MDELTQNIRKCRIEMCSTHDRYGYQSDQGQAAIQSRFHTRLITGKRLHSFRDNREDVSGHFCKVVADGHEARRKGVHGWRTGARDGQRDHHGEELAESARGRQDGLDEATDIVAVVEASCPDGVEGRRRCEGCAEHVGCDLAYTMF